MVTFEVPNSDELKTVHVKKFAIRELFKYMGIHMPQDLMSEEIPVYKDYNGN